MFRKGTLKTKLAMHLLQVGQCYKSDLYMVAKMMGDEAYGIKTINKMISEDDIVVRRVKNKSKTVSILALTRKAKLSLVNLLDEDYFYTHYKTFDKDFRTANVDTLLSRLDASRVKTMFSLAEVPTLPHDKPSLYHLFTTLYRLPYDYKEEFDNKPMYADQMTRDECEEMLSRGIYYTIKEVRDFLNEDIEGSSDTSLGSRAKGVFISKYNCLVVYSGRHGDNKLIRIRNEAEKRLLLALRVILQITNVNRALPSLSRSRQSNFDGSRVVDSLMQNTPYALVISDGESLIYSMATGNPRGLIKGTNKIKYDKQQKKRVEEKGMTVTTSWLKGDGAIFQRVFGTPFTENGINTLEYLCHTTAEEWQKTMMALMSDNAQFTYNGNNPLYPYDMTGKNLPCIYMPALEVNELYNIFQMDYRVAILTYQDLMNTIAHSVRKELYYFDADTLKMFPRDTVLIYDDNGYPKGQKLLEDYLKAQGKKATKKTYFDLPKQFGYDFVKFYNEIARGNIDVRKLFASVETSDIEEKETKRIKRKSITLTLGEEMTNNIYRAAKLYNMSASAYVKNLIHDKVIEDSDKYKEEIRNVRNT